MRERQRFAAAVLLNNSTAAVDAPLPGYSDVSKDYMMVML